MYHNLLYRDNLKDIKKFFTVRNYLSLVLIYVIV